jgi:hypothetical protein
VDSITTQLGAGVLANISSTTALSCIAASNTSPDTNPACIVGGGLGNGAIPITAYLTPPNTGLSATPPGTILGGIDLVTSTLGTVKGDLSVQQLSSGGLVGFLTSDVTTAPTISGALTSLTLNLNGQLPDGSPLTRMPTACSLATPTQMTAVYASATEGPTTASPDVDVSSTCTTGALASFTPTLTGFATKDASDSGAAVQTVLNVPATQAADKSTTLSVPGSVLAPNAAALLLANTTTSVGTVAATSPLIPGTISGQAFLTSNVTTGLGLSLRFTSPFAFTLNGSVSLSGSVTFPSIPDVPITVLAVSLSGGPQALFEAPCAASSGTLSSTLMAQNGIAAAPTSTFNVSGCTSSSGSTTVGKPKASGGSLSGLSKGHPKLHFKVTHGSNAPNIKTVSIGVPSGLSFHSSKSCKGSGRHRKCTTKVKGLSVSGGTVKSAKVSGGRLVITLKSAAGSVSVTVKGPGLTETNALKTKVKKHKVKSLTVSIKITNAKGSRSSISLKLKV